MNTATKIKYITAYTLGGGAAITAAWSLNKSTSSQQPSSPLSSFFTALPSPTTRIQCQAPFPEPKIVPHDPEPSQAVLLATFKRFLERNGADLCAADVKISPTDPNRFGIFANAETCRRTYPGLWTRLKTVLWLGPGNATLAKFPFETSITGSTILNNTVLGCGGSSGSSCTNSTSAQKQQNDEEMSVLQQVLAKELVDDRTAIVLYLLVEK